MYEKLWCKNTNYDAMGYSIAQFKSIFPKVARIMPHIWSDATKIYKEYVEGSIGAGAEVYQNMVGDIQKNIKRGFEKGYPLIRGMVFSLKENGKYQSKEIDKMLLVSEMFYQYLKRIKLGNKKEIHLFRCQWAL